MLLVPQGRISGALARFFGVESFDAHACAERGSLRAHGLAFTEQRGYDALLWASDLNFVRGEDSFVRAQWAARPFVWQIYPQTDDAHLPKLDAALDHYARTLDEAPRNALARFWHAWNGNGGATSAPGLPPDAPPEVSAQAPLQAPDWRDFAQYLPVFKARAEAWAAELAQAGDLAGNLAEFAKTQLK